MARVRDIELDEVPEDVQPIYSRYAEEYGPFLNQVKIFAHRPAALKHIMGLLLELAGEVVLPKRYLEIALVVVSKLNECTYCVAHHAPRLVDQGLPEGIDLVFGRRILNRHTCRTEIGIRCAVTPFVEEIDESCKRDWQLTSAGFCRAHGGRLAIGDDPNWISD